ncbi:uncharacterized protein [Macrobrachium rosenbergii]|uniref:uncharacterized protein n=1 Tax=Macrobrachium rosenbergii TaxID=79674 RepID=UPI0034D75E7F
MHCKVWISALCSFLLSLSHQHYASAFQPWDSRPSWLSLYTSPQRLRHPDVVGGSLEDAIEDASKDTMRIASEEVADSQEDFLPWEEEEEANEEGRDKDLGKGAQTLPEADGSSRTKRVFLSRGWMAGGYKAPEPSPNRFVRRPPALAPVPPSFPQPKPGDGPGNEAHYAALVSDQPQQSPPYRRFHSIFTSGMWTPLGKRSQGGDPFRRPFFFYI